MLVETTFRMTPWWHSRPTLASGTPGPGCNVKLGSGMDWTETFLVPS
jgi:hypothetical protein